jgi:hypothetical protein
MPGGLSDRQQKRIDRFLNYDFEREKQHRKERRKEKAQRKKKDRHKTRRQEIEEIVEQGFEDDPGYDG